MRTSRKLELTSNHEDVLRCALNENPTDQQLHMLLLRAHYSTDCSLFSMLICFHFSSDAANRFAWSCPLWHCVNTIDTNRHIVIWWTIGVTFYSVGIIITSLKPKSQNCFSSHTNTASEFIVRYGSMKWAFGKIVCYIYGHIRFTDKS